VILSPPGPRTTVRFTGYRAQADLIARQLAAGAELKEDSSLKKSKTPVVLILGRTTPEVSRQGQPDHDDHCTSQTTLRFGLR